jgi:D-beta-D-heptose 7-phosphate kinase/D-beta-D-heptose 1-phosphate adenosyltransferase
MQCVTRFLELLKSQKKPRVLVVGDCMLDEYYQVTVSRISPESPNVAVMVSGDGHAEAVRPGGAGNVCCQFRPFGVRCDFLGFVDGDASAYLSQAGVHSSDSLGVLHVPRKKRFFHGQTQVGNRWDVELPNYGLTPDALKAMQRKLWETLVTIRDDYDVFILSDYDKGVFANTSMTAHLAGKLTIVDPKKGPLNKWKGATVIKPNTQEAVALTGKTHWHCQCRGIAEETSCRAVVITNGSSGVYVNDRDSLTQYVPTSKLVANSVIGAGDSFAATLAVAMALGMGAREASEVAYHAGAIYVQGQHNSPVTMTQLASQSKYALPDELAKVGGRLVFTNGCFDILHAGHVETLRASRAMGDSLVVAVNSDEGIRRLKGPTRPVNGLADRMKLLAALECVDYVVSFDEDTPLELIKKIRPAVVAKGGDYKPEEVVGYGLAEIFIAPLVNDRSTTGLIKKLSGK